MRPPARAHSYAPRLSLLFLRYVFVIEPSISLAMISERNLSSKNLLTFQWCINLVDLTLPNGLEGHLQHFQCLLVQNIHVIDGVYPQD